MMHLPAGQRQARADVDDWLDAVELWVEDRDAWALDNLLETTRHLFDDVPLVYLLPSLPE